MVPYATEKYKFSTHWAPLNDEPDDLVAILGDVGKWQIVVVILMMMFNIPTVFHVASPEVYTPHEYWCRRTTNKLTDEQWRHLSSVTNKNLRGQQVVDPCYINKLPYDSVDYEDLVHINPIGIEPCKVWTYNTSRVTVTSQFNLACKWLPVSNAAESVYSLGAAFGGFLPAYLSDRIGRRNVLMVSQGIVVVLGFIIANASSYTAYLSMRALFGAASSGVLLCSSLICVEIPGGQWKDVLTTVFMYSYSLAYVLLFLLSQQFRNWIYLQYSITLMMIFLLTIWWLVPESPRWVLTVQDLPQLMLILRTITSFNRRHMLPGITSVIKNLPPMQVKPKRPSFTMLFKGEAIKRISIVSPFIYFFCNVTYFGLVLNPDIFDYPLFVSGAVEFLAVTVVLMLSPKNDVKMVVITTALSGLCCIIGACVIHKGYSNFLVLAARFFGGMANSSLSSMVATMYPTLFRTLGVGWCHCFAQLALAVAANIVLLGTLSTSLPLIILGLSSLLGSFAILFLPGRVCRDLLDLPEEVEYGHKVLANKRGRDSNYQPSAPKWYPSVVARRELNSEISNQDISNVPSSGKLKQQLRTVDKNEETVQIPNNNFLIKNATLLAANELIK